jgi:hypothetical protein
MPNIFGIPGQISPTVLSVDTVRGHFYVQVPGTCWRRHSFRQTAVFKRPSIALIAGLAPPTDCPTTRSSGSRVTLPTRVALWVPRIPSTGSDQVIVMTQALNL